MAPHSDGQTERQLTISIVLRLIRSLLAVAIKRMRLLFPIPYLPIRTAHTFGLCGREVNALE